MAVTESDLIELFRNGTTEQLNNAITTLTEQRGKYESQRVYDRALKAYNAVAEASDDPVHEFFGLTYSSYQVVPRVLAQSMPHDWQARFVACMEEMEAAFRHIETPECYDVQPAVEKTVGELTNAEMMALGISAEHVTAHATDFAYYDRDGNELEPWHRVPVHVPDPLPPYSRGRTRVPRADQIAADGGGPR